MPEASAIRLPQGHYTYHRSTILVSQIKIGFLRGIGFSIAMLLAWALIYVIVISIFDGWGSSYEEGDYVTFDTETKLTPKVLSYDLHDNQAQILGVINNDTDHTWERASVEIEFYAGETFVKECNEEVQARLTPQSTEHFELGCKSCDDEFPMFDRVEIKINNAWKAN